MNQQRQKWYGVSKGSQQGNKTPQTQSHAYALLTNEERGAVMGNGMQKIICGQIIQVLIE